MAFYVAFPVSGQVVLAVAAGQAFPGGDGVNRRLKFFYVFAHPVGFSQVAPVLARASHFCSRQSLPRMEENISSTLAYFVKLRPCTESSSTFTVSALGMFLEMGSGTFLRAETNS